MSELSIWRIVVILVGAFYEANLVRSSLLYREIIVVDFALWIKIAMSVISRGWDVMNVLSVRAFALGGNTQLIFGRSL